MTQSDSPVDRSPSDLLKYPHLDERKVELRWSKDWWDGPINGSASYRGRRYWFEFYCDDGEGIQYYYLVHPLSDEQADFADAWADENARLGDEWRPLGNDPTRRNSEAAKSLGEKWKAHEAVLPDYTVQQPIGWFGSGGNAAFYAIQVHPPGPAGG